MVIARNSSFTYKGRSVDVRTIGRELGVQSVLEGSIRRAGDRVRITAQLIDAASGGHIWAERYDRDLTDIFEVQDDVTRRIVDALKVTLSPGEKERLAEAKTSNLAAYDYLPAINLKNMGLAWPEFIQCGWRWSYCSIRSAAGLPRSSGGAPNGGGVIFNPCRFAKSEERLADLRSASAMSDTGYFGGCRPLTETGHACRPETGYNSLRLPAISVGSLTFGLVDYPNRCHPDVVRQGHAGESDVGSPGIGADGATTPETLRHQDRLAGRSGERRDTASTEGDIRTARRGLISQVPRQIRRIATFAEESPRPGQRLRQYRLQVPADRSSGPD
jgi:hypothetical protein